MLMLCDADEYNRELEQDGHRDAQNDRAVDIRAGSKEGGGDPHADMRCWPLLTERLGGD